MCQYVPPTFFQSRIVSLSPSRQVTAQASRQINAIVIAPTCKFRFFNVAGFRVFMFHTYPAIWILVTHRHLATTYGGRCR